MPEMESYARGGKDSSKNKLVRLAEDMKRHRHDFEDLYRELQENFNPMRGNFDPTSPTNRRGKKNNSKMLNSKPRLSLRTLQSGMQAGITSPARPWFRLIPLDEGLRDRYAVKTYTNDVERILRQYFQSTGTYNALHTSYGDIGLYGTDAAIFDEDINDGFRLHQLKPGHYWLGSSGNGLIDTLYYEDWFTVEHIVGRFVYRGNPRNEPDWTVASKALKSLWEKGSRRELIHVARMIKPRFERDPFVYTADNKRFASCWWEVGSEGDQMLRNSGYDQNPIIASRWYAEGEDVYGYSPAMDALPDAKMLQQQERDKNEAIRRMNRPPMNAPTSMRNTPFSLVPGALNFTDDANGVRPAYEVNPPVDAMRVDIRDTEMRIDTAMFADLFLMLANSDRRQITAREIDERHEEKLIGLGPVLELQHREKLRPLILNAYTTLLRQNRLPETPSELDGPSLTIDYISMLAQAQKAVATGAMERLFGFAGNLSATLPEVLDKLNGDEALDEYADMLGTPTRVLRDDDEVAMIRQNRAQQQQQAAQVEQAATLAPAAKQTADAAKVLADADATDSPRDVLRRIGVGI
ncbi:portal protein [Microcystis phage Mel-JY33]